MESNNRSYISQAFLAAMEMRNLLPWGCHVARVWARDPPLTPRLVSPLSESPVGHFSSVTQEKSAVEGDRALGWVPHPLWFGSQSWCKGKSHSPSPWLYSAPPQSGSQNPAPKKWISEPFTASYGSVEKEEQLHLVGADPTGILWSVIPVSVHPQVENKKGSISKLKVVMKAKSIKYYFRT